MAVERVSPGVYRDTSTGKTVNAKTSAEASKKLGAGGGGGGKKKKKKDEKIELSDSEKKQQEIEETASTVDTILGKGKTFGEELVSKYIPKGTFGQIDANRSKEMADYLAGLKNLASNAYNFTPYEQQAIDAVQAGMAGYAAPEMQAMRESAMQGVNQDLMTQMRLQELANARNRVRGASAGAGQLALQEGAQQTRGNIERDLFIKNADEVQKRKLDFASLVNQTEAARFGRKTTSEGMYGGALSGAESLETAKQQFNIGQTQNEALAQMGGVLGGIGAYTGSFGGQQGVDLAKENMELLRKQQEDYNKEMQRRMKLLEQQANMPNTTIASSGTLI